MYQKDYDVENEKTVKRSEQDDTLYVLNHFLSEFQHKDDYVLDLGCGDGHYHQFIENQVIGIDKNHESDLIVKQDLEKFPYKGLNKYSPFKFIFSLDTFEHLERPDVILKYLFEDDHILAKNGYIFLSVPNINTIDDKLNNINQAVYNPNLKQSTSGRWNSTHLRFFDVDSMIYMCQNSGFKIKAFVGSNFHTSNMFKQLGESLFKFGLDGINFCNALRNTEFNLYAPNICILIQK